MISMSSNSRLLAAAGLCAMALAGCDSIKDVRDEPFTAIPTPTVVLQGTVTGLGTRRPVVLQSVVTSSSGTINTERDFFGTEGTTVSPFTFGSIPVGSSYAITVLTQPYAKVCTVNNGTGTAAANLPAITVNCVNDPAVERYSVSGTISPAVGAIETARVFLTTEEGVQELPAFGQTNFVFEDVVFDSRTSLPVLTWRVTASYTSPDGTVNNCNVNAGTNDAGDSTVPPSADVTNVAITACTFDVRGSVQYSTFPGGGAAPAIGAGGVTLGLRNIATGEAVPGAPDVTVNAFGTATVPLWSGLLSNANAVYDVVVAGQPAGQTCIARVTSGTTALTYHGTALWLMDPVVPARFQPNGVAVRCRNSPSVVANQLEGTYMYLQRDPNNNNAINNRRFLTFFPEGTYIYANHSSTGGATGVEYGFYNYNAATGQLVMTVYIDTNGGNVAGSSNLQANLSFSGMVGFSTGGGHGHVTLTNVVKTPAPNSRLTIPFTGKVAAISPATGTVNVPLVWEMYEPKSVDGQMTGAWIPADHRRSWVFNFDDTTGIHFGVNGPVNLQDGCFVFDDGTASSGYYTRRGGSTGCMTTGAGYATGFATFDTPGVGASTLPPGWLGKFPGSQGAFDGRPPSPNTFVITAGDPDALTVQGALNGTPIGTPQTFYRTRAN